MRPRRRSCTSAAIVEVAEREDALFATRSHPYTQALLSAVPVPDPVEEAERRRIVLEGDVPSPLSPPSGCSFHPRCAARERVDGERCERDAPELVALGEGRRRACHLEDH